jgi:predicted nucleotidyltransferase component of viral defense system
MIQIEFLKEFFPPAIRDQIPFQKLMMKEYIQLAILDFLSTTPHIRKITFIGGTNLRLIKGIDRFSEDLYFDCKDFSREEFMEMTDSIVLFLKRSGMKVEVRDRDSKKLQAFRRNIHFPEFLFELGLSGHKEERFLIKVESQAQQLSYDRTMVNIKGCGFYFPFPVPPDGVLCSMKLAAMLSRRKGRDFYDAMFLLSQTSPDYTTLSEMQGISELNGLKSAVARVLETTDLDKKKRDFEHLLFTRKNSERILSVGKFFKDL